MGFKRKPSASLQDLLEGQPRKDVPGKSQPKLPPPPSKPQPLLTRSSSALPQPAKPSFLVQHADPKRKRFAKGKDPVGGGRSRTSQEKDEGRWASKQLRVAPQVQEKEVVVQPEPQAWLPAPMLHGEPLMDDASLWDFNKGKGTYVADALERSLLLPTDMADLKNLRRQELFLSMKRYLGMVRFSTFVAFLAFVPWLPTYTLLVSNGRPSKLLLEWRRWPMTKVGPWTLSVKSVWMPREPSRTPRSTF